MLSDLDIFEQFNDILTNKESNYEFLDELCFDDDSVDFIYLKYYIIWKTLVPITINIFVFLYNI